MTARKNRVKRILENDARREEKRDKMYASFLEEIRKQVLGTISK
ncbi:MAG: hypothetical protein ABIA97_01810 [Candidatus Omnitrophota bacterium]